ncbi:MAG TPA: TolC family protein [Oscillospiraceae bacterium]|nr:TolC family protein [Oscillospiraceae bacterium]
MTKALFLDFLREIKNTRSRFFSIFILIALATAFFSGLRATAPDMHLTADSYFDDRKLMDVRILSTLGLTDEDIAALAATDGVEAAEGAFTIDAVALDGGNELVVKVHSLSPSGMNAPVLVEGRMPQAADECVAEPALLTKLGISLGDTVTLQTGEGDYADALRCETFTVVGTVQSPLYISRERGTSTLGTGTVAAYLLLPAEAFDMDSYTEADLRLTGAADLACYSDAYEDKVDDFLTALEPLADTRAALREKNVRTEAEEDLQDGWDDYNEAKTEADEKLADAWQELADARVILDDGWAEYHDGVETLKQETADGQADIAEAEAELADTKAELDEGEESYLDGQAELQSGEADYADGLSEYETSLQEYEEGLRAYEDGATELADAKAELDDAKAQLDDAKAELSGAQEEFAAARAQLDDAEAQYEAGLSNFNALMDGLVQTLAAPPLSLSVTADELLDPSWDWDATGTGAVAEAYLAAAVPGYDGSVPAGVYLRGAKAQLDDARAQLDANWDEYYRGRQDYREGLAEYQNGLAEYKDGLQQYEDGLAELEDSKADLDEAAEALADAKAELENAREELDDGWADLADSRAGLDDGWRQYEDGLTEVEDAKAQLLQETEGAKMDLAEALDELQDGENDYADGLSDYEESKAETEESLADALLELGDAQSEVDGIDAGKWYLLGRDSNPGYAGYGMDADRMSSLASLFPLIFFLVAALVCLTTMTRMVDEQRTQIGVLGALGYGRFAIASKYMGYGLIASVGGSAVGITAGCLGLPEVIYTAWQALYTLPPLQFTADWGSCLFALSAAVFSTAVASLAASFAALSSVPATLMRPRAPRAGKRVFLERVGFIWKRLSFTRKVTMRNLFRYRRRFFMTVLGIGGCTALIVVAFGLRDSIFSIMDIQYDELFHYRYEAVLDDGITQDELDTVSGVLEAENSLVPDWAFMRMSSVTLEGAEGSLTATLVVGDAADITRFITLRDRGSGDTVPLTDKGAVLTEKAAELLGVSVGDTLVLDDDGRVTVTVAGITENYTLHYLYMTDAYYASVRGSAETPNAVLFTCSEDTSEAGDAASAALLACDGVTAVSRMDNIRTIMEESVSVVDYVVVLITLSAAALAFVVLYNLTNINITERLRELATIKVLGFYDSEVSAYVSRENRILTVFGVLAGLPMGFLLHHWVIRTVEIDFLMFGRSASTRSYVFAAGLTLLFALLVEVATHGRLKKIDMVESLKTVE